MTDCPEDARCMDWSRLRNSYDRLQKELAEAKVKIRANFLWPAADGSVNNLGYEFCNATTRAYQKECWDRLCARISAQAQKELAKAKAVIERMHLFALAQDGKIAKLQAEVIASHGDAAAQARREALEEAEAMARDRAAKWPPPFNADMLNLADGIRRLEDQGGKGENDE